MPEPIVVAIGVLAAGALVVAPLLRHRVPDAGGSDLEAAQLRHRIALETVRDIEADCRAGSLDAEAYERELAAAELRAAETRRALDATAEGDTSRVIPDGSGRRVALVVAGVIGAVLVIGSALPGTGLANGTVVNEQLAAQQEAEAERQARITELLDRLSDDPRDAESLSDLADEYLAGGTGEELSRAAVALRLLIELEPERADAYERIIGAYLSAGDYANGAAALDAYRSIDDADPAELAFFEGLIALRGDSDADAALAAFDRFLELAPDDPRVPMVRALRDEAAAAAE